MNYNFTNGIDYKKLINERGLKQKWVAQQTGIPLSRLNLFINNKMYLKEDRIKKLNEFFGIE